jgi:hypothetical protein
VVDQRSEEGFTANPLVETVRLRFEVDEHTARVSPK